jgi:hypothetical protein
MAGDGDRVVSYRLAERLDAAISGSSLQIIQGAGLKVHHVADDHVVEAILTVQGIRGRHLIRTPSEPRASGEKVTTQVASVHGAMRPR